MLLADATVHPSLYIDKHIASVARAQISFDADSCGDTSGLSICGHPRRKQQTPNCSSRECPRFISIIERFCLAPCQRIGHRDDHLTRAILREHSVVDLNELVMNTPIDLSDIAKEQRTQLVLILSCDDKPRGAKKYVESTVVLKSFLFHQKCRRKGEASDSDGANRVQE